MMLRRATWASRASIAPKAFQFNRADSFRYGAGTGFRGWARKYGHQIIPRPQPSQQKPLPESAIRLYRRKHRRRWNSADGLRVLRRVLASVGSVRASAWRNASGARNRREW